MGKGNHADRAEALEGAGKPPPVVALMTAPPGLGLEPAAARKLTPQALRALLVSRGLCDPAAPEITVELTGALRLRTRCALLPLHAASIRDAVDVLLKVCPQAARLIPDPATVAEHYRFSINGRTVTADPAHALTAGDHVLLFNASVGG